MKQIILIGLIEEVVVNPSNILSSDIKLNITNISTNKVGVIQNESISLFLILI